MRTKFFLLMAFVFLGMNCKKVPADGLYRVNLHDEAKKTADLRIGDLLECTVERVVDGDTIVVTFENPPEGFDREEKVRFLGVDTPESVAPGRPVEFFAIEAGNFTKAGLLGKKAYLAFDWDLRDNYHRLLAYIYTADNVCFNGLIISEGYGHAYLKYAFKYRDEFAALQKTAQANKVGLWGD